MSVQRDSWQMTTITRFAFFFTAIAIELYGSFLRLLSLILHTTESSARSLFRSTLGRSTFIEAFAIRVKNRYREIISEVPLSNVNELTATKRLDDKGGPLVRDELLVGNRSYAGDVPGWVLVVLMTTGLVTALWTIAAPRLSAILRNSLDAMNGIR